MESIMKRTIFLMIIIFSFYEISAQQYSVVKQWEIAGQLKTLGDIDQDGIWELVLTKNDTTVIIYDGKTGLEKYNLGKNGYLEVVNYYKYTPNDLNGNTVLDFLTDRGTIIDPSTKQLLFDFRKLNLGSYMSITGPYDFDNNKTIDFLISDGNKTYLYSSSIISTSVLRPDSEIPSGYSLEQNYPTPFNPTTTIEYTLQKNGVTKVELFDSLGKLINVIDEGYKTSGKHRVSFDNSSLNLASGVYYYRLIYDGNADTKKMILLK